MRLRPSPDGGRVFIGTSGYVYRHWRSRFYPASLPGREWLSFYAEHFGSVELNSPFYRLPDTRTFEAWRDAVPRGFVFSVKGSRFLTHMKKLRDPEGPLELFLERARALGPTLGPVLFQLPETFPLSLPRLDEFLDALARQRLVKRLRAVLEVRHPSWLDDEVTGRLRRAGVALCFADWKALPVTGPVTADFVYLRRHGVGARYGGSYSPARLGADAASIQGWLREGRDVYVYFNNDENAFAVRNALRLVDLVTSSAVTRQRAFSR